MGKIRGHIRSNVIGYLALFVALSGTAWAATELDKNEVKSKHIKNAGVKTKDLAKNAVNSRKVADGSLLDIDFAPGELPQGEQGPPGPSTGPAGGDLTGNYPDPTIAANAVGGAEVQESTLGQVPSALLGGLGRSSGGGSCDPTTTTFVTCALVTTDLPAPARLLLIGQATGNVQPNPEGAGQGTCHFGSTSGPVPETTTSLFVQPSGDHFSMVAVSGVFPPGQHSFGIDCNQTDSDREIRFDEAGIAAVAISPD